MTNVPVITKRDVAALLRNFLLGQVEVTNLCGDQIVTSHNFDPSLSLAYPRLIIDFNSGSGRYQGGLQNWIVDIYSYSDESQDSADALYDTMYLALQAERLWDPTGAIPAAGYGRELERPESGYNGQTRAWYARGSWMITTAG